MLLRRISKHVKDENWFAVAIDFFIVVMGVLLGLQAQQWIEGRAAAKDYRAALSRLDVEIDANLAEAQRVNDELGWRLDEAREGLNLLQSCSPDPKDKEAVDQTLKRFIGTMGMKLHINAIDELTTDSRLLARQSPDERKKYADLKRLLLVFQREANFMETLPLQERFENNPLIDIGPSEIHERTYQGRTWKTGRRALSLNVPLDQACRNNDLIKSLYYWEKWQSEMLGMADILSAELEPLKD